MVKHWRLNARLSFVARLEAGSALHHVRQRSGWVASAAFVDSASNVSLIAKLANGASYC